MSLCELLRHKNKNKNDVNFAGQVVYAYPLSRICAESTFVFPYFCKTRIFSSVDGQVSLFLPSKLQGQALLRLPCGHYVRSEPRRSRWIYAGPGMLFVEVHGATPGPGATAELLRAPLRSTAGSSPGVYLYF